MHLKKRYAGCLSLSICLLAKAMGAEAAAPLALAADWTYQGSKAQAGRLAERYTADYRKRLDLTEKMAMDTTLRCSQQTGINSSRRDVTPSLSYLIANDLFFFTLSGTDTETYSNGAEGDRANRALAATWNSAWSRGAAWWLPTVSLNTNRNWQEDSLSPSRQDRDDRGAGGSLDWDLALGRVFYNANSYQASDAVSGNESKTTNQLTRIETDASFLDGRGNLTLSQQIASLRSDYSTGVIGGIALLPVTVTAYHGESSANPVTLAAKPALTDGNRELTAVAVNNPVQPMQIAVRSPNLLPVDRLFLYTDVELTPAITAQFSWALYTSSNNLDWDLAQATILANYNPFDRRFEFVLPPSGKEYVKLVAVHDPAITAVNFTEIEAFQAVSASGSRLTNHDRQDTYQTDANLNLALRPNLQLTTTLAYMKNTSQTGLDMNNTGLSSGLRWNPAPQWSVQANGNHSLRTRSGGLNDENRSYGLSLGFPTLPSINSSLGLSLSESYEGGKMTTSGRGLGLLAIADLYRDLTGRLNSTFTKSDSRLTDRQTDTLATSVGLTARLTPGLIADWTTTVSEGSNQGSTVSTAATSTWRVSDNLSLRGNFDSSWGETEASDVAAGFDMGLTDSMQVSLTQRRQLNPDPSNITAVDWRWTITRALSMMTSGAFLYGGREQEWNLTSRLSTRFTSF